MEKSECFKNHTIRLEIEELMLMHVQMWTERKEHAGVDQAGSNDLARWTSGLHCDNQINKSSLNWLTWQDMAQSYLERTQLIITLFYPW